MAAGHIVLSTKKAATWVFSSSSLPELSHGPSLYCFHGWSNGGLKGVFVELGGKSREFSELKLWFCYRRSVSLSFQAELSGDLKYP